MSDFWTELDGEQEFERGIDAAIASASDGVRHAVAEGLEVGAQWARQNHSYKDQSGKLTKSIKAVVEVSTPGGAVGRIESRRPYDRFVEKGTPPHEIDARKKKALAWPGGAHPVKSVQHPGTDPRPFIAPAGAMAKQHIERSIELDIVLNLEKHLQD